MEFEFDPAKSAANAEKHGISFTDAQALWGDPHAVEIDLATSPEQRFAAVGEVAGKRWTAIYTYRGAALRLISVRRSRKKEEAFYEKLRFG